MTFFSGTDTATLREEGSNMNHFLSLIVNNEGTYTARITRKLNVDTQTESHIVSTTTKSYNTYENQNIMLEDNTVSERDEIKTSKNIVIEWYAMNIHKAVVETPFSELSARLREIEQNNTAKTTKAAKTTKTTSIPTLSFYEEPSFLKPKDAQTQLEPFSNDILEEDSYYSKFSSYGDFSDTIVNEILNNEVVPVEITKNLCTKLLCSSILIRDAKTINLENWVKKMDRLYENVFGNIKIKNIRLEHWIEYFVEQLLYYSVNSEYEQYIVDKYNLGKDFYYEDTDLFIKLYSICMIDYLSTLPYSIVKNMMIKSLKTIS